MLQVCVHGIRRETEPFGDLAAPKALCRETGHACLRDRQGIGIATPAPNATPGGFQLLGRATRDAFPADRVSELPGLRQQRSSADAVARATEVPTVAEQNSRLQQRRRQCTAEAQRFLKGDL